MERLSPVGLDNLRFVEGALPAAYVRFEMKAAPGDAVIPPADNQGEDIDGCDVQVDVATSDEDLPAAEGGVA